MPTNYDALIDAEIWSFIRKTQQFYPDNTAELAINEQRKFYNKLCDGFKQPYPQGVTSADDTIQYRASELPIPVRRYRYDNTDTTNNSCFCANTKTAKILYFHGGGYVVGNLDSHDDICAELCAFTGMELISVDYRLSPEHKHPAAFEDCLNAVVHEAEADERAIILCGDSAGGNLAAAVAHHVRPIESLKLAGQLLIYPELGGKLGAGSYLEHATAPMLSAEDVEFYLQVRLGEGATSYLNKPVDILHDPSFAPLKDTDFSQLPNTFVFSAQCDPLSDDGNHYCEKIRVAGGKAQWHNEAGLVHGYLRARHSSERARVSFSKMVKALIEIAEAV